MYHGVPSVVRAESRGEIGSPPHHLAQESFGRRPAEPPRNDRCLALLAAPRHRVERAQQLGQRAAVEVLHHDVVQPLLAAAAVVDRHNVRMAKRRQQHRLAREPLLGRSTRPEPSVEDLHRHRTAELQVHAPVDHAHRPCAQPRHQSVALR
jgi:hypothetical protein